MRRLFASRGTTAAFVGALALFAAGGGYALASGGSANTIHACVHKSGGGIYIAKPCAKGDKAISWNRVGPRGKPGPRGKTGAQGPGATSINFNTAGSASPTPVTIGRVGPLVATGTCTTTGTGAGATTTFVVNYSRPALKVDGSIISSGDSVPISETAGASSSARLGTLGPTSTQAVESAQLFVIPTGHAPVDLMITAAANGGSPVNGSTADSCHLSAVITPVATPTG